MINDINESLASYANKKKADEEARIKKLKAIKLLIEKKKSQQTTTVNGEHKVVEVGTEELKKAAKHLKMQDDDIVKVLQNIDHIDTKLTHLQKIESRRNFKIKKTFFWTLISSLAGLSIIGGVVSGVFICLNNVKYVIHTTNNIDILTHKHQEIKLWTSKNEKIQDNVQLEVTGAPITGEYPPAKSSYRNFKPCKYNEKDHAIIVSENLSTTDIPSNTYNEEIIVNAIVNNKIVATKSIKVTDIEFFKLKPVDKTGKEKNFLRAEKESMGDLTEFDSVNINIELNNELISRVDPLYRPATRLAIVNPTGGNYCTIENETIKLIEYPKLANQTVKVELYVNNQRRDDATLTLPLLTLNGYSAYTTNKEGSKKINQLSEIGGELEIKLFYNGILYYKEEGINVKIFDAEGNHVDSEMFQFSQRDGKYYLKLKNKPNLDGFEAKTVTVQVLDGDTVLAHLTVLITNAFYELMIASGTGCFFSDEDVTTFKILNKDGNEPEDLIVGTNLSREFEVIDVDGAKNGTTFDDASSQIQAAFNDGKTGPASLEVRKNSAQNITAGKEIHFSVKYNYRGLVLSKNLLYSQNTYSTTIMDNGAKTSFFSKSYSDITVQTSNINGFYTDTAKLRHVITDIDLQSGKQWKEYFVSLASYNDGSYVNRTERDKDDLTSPFYYPIPNINGITSFKLLDVNIEHPKDFYINTFVDEYLVNRQKITIGPVPLNAKTMVGNDWSGYRDDILENNFLDDNISQTDDVYKLRAPVTTAEPQITMKFGSYIDGGVNSTYRNVEWPSFLYHEFNNEKHIYKFNEIQYPEMKYIAIQTQNFYLPKTLSIIGEKAFANTLEGNNYMFGQKEFENIYFYDNIVSIGPNIFENCMSRIRNIYFHIDYNIPNISHLAFQGLFSNDTEIRNFHIIARHLSDTEMNSLTEKFHNDYGVPAKWNIVFD